MLLLAQAEPELACPVLRRCAAATTAEAVHAVTHQGALDLDDLSRRTRVTIETPDRGRAAAAVIAPVVSAPRLGGSETRAAEALERYLRLRDAEAAAEAAPDDGAAAAAYRAVLDA